MSSLNVFASSYQTVLPRIRFNIMRNLSALNITYEAHEMTRKAGSFGPIADR